MLHYETAAIFKERMTRLRQEEFWRRFEQTLTQEEGHTRQLKREYMRISTANRLNTKYLRTASQMILTTGGVQAENMEEAARNTKELFEERRQLATQLKKECVTYKNDKLNASVLALFPLIDAQLGCALRARTGKDTRINMALASWRY